MNDWVRELSTTSPEELLILEDGWADFLADQDIQQDLKQEKLARFQQMIIFLKRLTQPEDKEELKNEQDEVFSFLSGLSEEQLRKYYQNYKWLLDDYDISPFDKRLTSDEIVQRTRQSLILSLFNEYCQEPLQETKKVLIEIARVLNIPLFGLTIGEDGCFKVIFSKEVSEKAKFQGKPLPAFFWENINGGYRIYPPKQNGHNSYINIGDYCLELEINKPCLNEQRKILSYQGKDPQRVVHKTDGDNYFGSLTFTDYRGDTKKITIFQLIESASSDKHKLVTKLNQS